MALHENVILTDIDGVVLDWFPSFDVWMRDNGYEVEDPSVYDISNAYGISKSEGRKLIRLFNDSAHMGYLPSFRDSIKYMKKIHEEKGYVFHAITSQSSNHNAQKLRIMNLQRLFGEALFDKFIILDCGADKNAALEQYRDSDCLWVEDKIENALVGQEMGLDSILMRHDHNKHCDKIPLFHNWKEIYEIV
jgi:hypothetical protein|tara:strand:- start:7985 stop:8557 length:573 start_codon:yes stop_codon:yes gene_type:complete